MDALIDPGSVLRAGAALVGLSLPGFALLGRAGFARALAVPFRIGLGVVTALAVHVVVAFLLRMAGASFPVAFWAALALCVLSLPFAPALFRAPGSWLGPGLIGAALFAFGLAATRPITCVSDAVDHVATVATILDTGELEPNTVFYADGDGATPDIRKGFYHVWLAELARLADLDASETWYALQPFALMLAGFIFAGLVGELVGGERLAGALALVAFPLLIHGNSAWFLDTFLYPHNVDWLMIWAVLALFLAEIEEPSAGRRRLLLLLAAALAPVHVFAPVLMLAAAITFPAAIVVLGFRARARRAAGLWLAVLAATLPALVIRLVQAYHPVNPLHIEASEVFYITSFLTLHTPDPMLQRFSAPALLIALMSVPLLWRRDRRTWRRAALAGLCWGPLLVSLNPIAGAILQPKLGYLFVRFLGIVPYPLVAAVIVADATRGTARLRRRVITRWLPAALVIALAALRFPALWDLTTDAAYQRDLAISPESWREGFALLDRELPVPGTTVFTDPVTGYCVPAYSKARVVATLDQHASPSDSTILRRLDDVERVPSPFRPLSEAIAIMRARNARYVFLNLSFTSDLATHFDVRPAGSDDVFTYRFEQPGAPFRKLGDAGHNRFVLYELLDDVPGELPPPFPVSYFTVVPADRVISGEPIAIHPDFTLLGTKMRAVGSAVLPGAGSAGGPVRLAAGGTLEVWVALRKDRDVDPATPFRLVLRGRRDLTGDEARFRPFERLYARLVGKTSGRRLEFGTNRRVLDGLYPAALWDVGEVVVDLFLVRLPADLEPGIYPVGLKLHEQRVIRNIALRDWLRPTGGIGLPVGEVEVLPEKGAPADADAP